jgi:hypothetical protein
MARRLVGDSHWQGWGHYSRVCAVLMLVSVLAYGVSSTGPTGFAGVFERVAFLIPILWTCTFLRRLSAGTPFMISAPSRLDNQARRSRPTRASLK